MKGLKVFTKKAMSLLVATAMILSSTAITYANPAAPETIRIGLSYSNAATNNFVLKSDGGMKISIKNATGYMELFSYGAATGLKIRKDSYYNIINNKETEIDYKKVVIYTGELAGPYHIQIGDVYPSMEEAKKVADSMISLTQTAFLAYEDGWRVWAQLYLDEGECAKQIQVFQNEKPEYQYSVVAPIKKRVQMFDAVTGQLLYVINAEQEIRFEPIPTTAPITTISYNSAKYRGFIYIKRMSSGVINVANTLPYEQYLYGVVPSEMPSSWHIEALKAQAVAARNYGMLSLGKHGADGFDLCNGPHCQAYHGFNHEKLKTNQAVDETKGKLLTYNDKLVSTYYHSSSGGRTENSENIWTQTLPYIRAVDDKYGLGSPYDNWSKPFNKTDISKKLNANTIDVGDIVDIVPTQISENGRVTMLEVRGTKGISQLAKGRFRSIMGSNEIRSSWYTIATDADIFMIDKYASRAKKDRAGNLYVLSASGKQKLSSADNKVFIKGKDTITTSSIIPNVYTFSGKGWGHGLGMSQYGAKGMAEAGFNFIQILEYYYTGAKVK